MEIFRDAFAGAVTQDLKRKMVFISGPRQVGKTTFAVKTGGRSGQYYNWDFAEHREKILKGIWPGQRCILLLDEIHKYRRWRNLVKGLYDVNKDKYNILITGSARLDAYRKTGDSLQGRYHHYRMHPLTLRETDGSRDAWDSLYRFGGFPEPFLMQSETDAKRWRRDYRTRLIREELASLENFQDLGTLEILAMRLPALVGSPLSVNSVREDLQVNHRTADKWIQSLDSLYYIYRILPFGSPNIKAVKKEKKHYHWDWSLVQDKGSRFENMVASHFLSWIHFLEDSKGEDLELRFFRDSEKREADFVIVRDGKPFLFAECKYADADISPHLKYLKNKFQNVPAYQLYYSGRKRYTGTEGITVMSAYDFFREKIPDSYLSEEEL